MNINTGQLISGEQLNSLPPAERENYVEVKRDLSALETAKMQIKFYKPCGCGSGKKFKFCCFKKKTT